MGNGAWLQASLLRPRQLKAFEACEASRIGGGLPWRAPGPGEGCRPLRDGLEFDALVRASGRVERVTLGKSSLGTGAAS